MLIVSFYIRIFMHAYRRHFQKGSVSGSGTGPGDPGSRGLAMPDPETFPYEWLGAPQ